MMNRRLGLIVLIFGFLQNCGEATDCRQCIHISNVARPQVFYLKMQSGNPNRVRLNISSNLNSEAELELVHYVYNRKITIPVKAEDIPYSNDWYPDTLTIRYNPKKATKGEVMIKWKLS